MDHITSRFRRNKKDSLATPGDQSPVTTPTETTTAAEGNVSHLNEKRNSVPSLTITTSPDVTTPPGSSHGGILPRSPLRGFSHFRSNHKRARSPAAPVQNKTTDLYNSRSHSNSNLPRMDGSADEPLTLSRKVSKKPQLPFFLNLSDAGTLLFWQGREDYTVFIYGISMPG